MTAKTNHKTSTGTSSYGKIVLQRIFNIISTLVVIAYLTIFVLILAERGRDHLPAQPLQSAETQFLVLFYTFLIIP